MNFDNQKALQEEDAYLNQSVGSDPDEKLSQLMMENIGLKKRLQELEKSQQVKFHYGCIGSIRDQESDFSKATGLIKA